MDCNNSGSVDKMAPEFQNLNANSPALMVMPLSAVPMTPTQTPTWARTCKQFWKAGDYEAPPTTAVSHDSLDRVRVHPKFLHSNATSHKWALGAFAELLDNSIDEISHGATYVNVDMVQNVKDGSQMLVVQDNGGGMNPDTMRHCMSFGYSAKSKLGNTIGQYGNGFKTSTMRLGADVMVFSRCKLTQSIGMLSYTFLTGTGKDDIVVPILDYEKTVSDGWKARMHSAHDWNTKLDAMVQWSPYSSEADLLGQFEQMEDQGTRVIIYNLWHNDQEDLELDFDAHAYDIQLRGVNRDEAKIEMANKFPNSKHFLTYQHSLRSYASILYLRLPADFRIVLRGQDVQPHDITTDMMLIKRCTYRPHSQTDMHADVTMGFVKDAKEHVDVQGFNVYHKNRLIKPFWRVWNAAGSDGRGVIGVLEANFIEPAHDKQGFENTAVLNRLRNRLLDLQKDYWKTNCHEIGYAPRTKRTREEFERRIVPYVGADNHGQPQRFASSPQPKEGNLYTSSSDLENKKLKSATKKAAAAADYYYYSEEKLQPEKQNSNKQLKETREEQLSDELELERKKCMMLEGRVKEQEGKIALFEKEQDKILELLDEEKMRNQQESAALKNQLKEASDMIEALQKKVKMLENLLMINKVAP